MHQRAYSLYQKQKPAEQQRLLRTLLSNCTFTRGSLSPTYNKSFDLLVEGNEKGNWLGGRDSFRPIPTNPMMTVIGTASSANPAI